MLFRNYAEFFKILILKIKNFFMVIEKVKKKIGNIRVFYGMSFTR